MELLVFGVVVRDVRGIPESLDPGQEDLSSEFPQRARVDESRNKLIRETPAERAAPDAIPPAEVDQAPRFRLLPGTGDVVPARRVRQPRVEHRTPEHVHFVLVREPGLLPATQR